MYNTNAIKKLGRLFLNPSRYENIKSSLKVGEHFSGKVIQKYSENKYLVNIKGEEVIAESENIFREGISYKFEVLRLTPKIELKISIPDLKILEGKIEFLNQLNLQPSKINFAILDFFVNNDLPLNYRGLSFLSTILNSIYPSIKNDNEVEKRVKSSIFLLQKGIPIKKELIEIISYYLFGKPQIENEIYELISFLKKIIESDILKEKDITESLLSMLGKLTIKFDDNDFNYLKDYFKLIGMNYESKLLELINQVDYKLEFLKISGIKGNLLLFLGMLEAEKEKFLWERESYEILKSTVKKVLDYVEYMQIMNYYQKKEQYEFDINYYYLIYVLYGNKIYPVEIILKGKKEKKNIPKKFVIAIFIFIGENCVEVILEIFQNDMKITFKTEDKKFLFFLEKIEEELKDAICSLGFNVKNMSLNKIDNVLSDRENILLINEMKKSKKIDVFI